MPRRLSSSTTTPRTVHRDARRPSSATEPTKLPPLPLPLPPTTLLLRQNTLLEKKQVSDAPPLVSVTPDSVVPLGRRPSRTGRTRDDALQNRSTKAKPLFKKTRRQWTSQEDELVLKGLQIHGDATRKWLLIAQTIPGRTGLQVKSRARRLLPDVYGDKRQRHPSAPLPLLTSTHATQSSPESSDGGDHDVQDDADDLSGSSEGDDQSEAVSVGSAPGPQSNPPSPPVPSLSVPLASLALQRPARITASPPPARRPRRLSGNNKHKPPHNLPPLPHSPPPLTTWRASTALPPLPTTLALVSSPPQPALPTSRRRTSSTTTVSRKRLRETTPPSPLSSLSSAPASPDLDLPPSPTSKHSKSNLLDPFTLLRPHSPQSPRPYTLVVDPRALALMDVHAHLLDTEIIGLLGGIFDAYTRTLHVRAVYPCDSPAHTSAIQCEMDPVAETRARDVFGKAGLHVVGWYHSHPRFDPWPSVRDVETQGVYQRLFSTNRLPRELEGHEEGQGFDGSVEPFVGAIVTPYHAHRPTIVSQVAFFSVGGADHHLPFRVDPTFSGPGADVSESTVLSLDLFDEFRQHHQPGLQHLAQDYHGWKRYTKLKHSVRSHTGIDVDAQVDEFFAQVLGSDARLLEAQQVASKVEQEEETPVDDV